jgi:hypothetical protein
MSEPGVVRRRRSGVEVERLVSEYEVSGLTRPAFCVDRGLSVAALDKYRRRVHGKRQSRGRSFVPVEVVSSTAQGANRDAGCDGVLFVELRSGRRIEVSRGFDAETLERLLAVLDRA